MDLVSSESCFLTSAFSLSAYCRSLILYCCCFKSYFHSFYVSLLISIVVVSEVIFNHFLSKVISVSVFTSVWPSPVYMSLGLFYKYSVLYKVSWVNKSISNINWHLNHRVIAILIALFLLKLLFCLLICWYSFESYSVLADHSAFMQ